VLKRALAVCLFACSVFAADWEAGMRHMNTTMSSDAPLDIRTSRGFGATLGVFVTRNISIDGAAIFINPEVTANGVDLGTLGMQTYSLGARFHFSGQSRFSVFAGAGAALVSLGDLDDQLEADDVYVTFERETTFYAEAGLRYHILPSVALEAGVSYMPLGAELQIRRTNIALPPSLDLDPITVTVAAAYRF
jgi:outer membrane protein W